MLSDAFAQRAIDFAPRSGKVLLVDEDTRDLNFFRLILEGQGYEVYACASFAAGVQCLEAESFDFVLVSQGSQAFEGRTVLERAIELNRQRAVLVVTRCTDMSCYLEAMQMGAVDYLEKPVAPDDLLRFIRTHLQYNQLAPQQTSA
jgi:DNA-binding response OmpR family regulator